jgi:hypothetical protein
MNAFNNPLWYNVATGIGPPRHYFPAGDLELAIRPPFLSRLFDRLEIKPLAGKNLHTNALLGLGGVPPGGGGGPRGGGGGGGGGDGGGGGGDKKADYQENVVEDWTADFDFDDGSGASARILEQSREKETQEEEHLLDPRRPRAKSGEAPKEAQEEEHLLDPRRPRARSGAAPARPQQQRQQSVRLYPKKRTVRVRRPINLKRTKPRLYPRLTKK